MKEYYFVGKFGYGLYEYLGTHLYRFTSITFSETILNLQL